MIKDFSEELEIPDAPVLAKGFDNELKAMQVQQYQRLLSELERGLLLNSKGTTFEVPPGESLCFVMEPKGNVFLKFETEYKDIRFENGLIESPVGINLENVTWWQRSPEGAVDSVFDLQNKTAPVVTELNKPIIDDGYIKPYHQMMFSVCPTRKMQITITPEHPDQTEWILFMRGEESVELEDKTF